METKSFLYLIQMISSVKSSVHEVMISARDTTKEIREAAKELKEHGIRDTDTNVKQTTFGAREKGKMVKHNAGQVGESDPPTGDAGTKVKSKRKTRSYRR